MNEPGPSNPRPDQDRHNPIPGPQPDKLRQETNNLADRVYDVALERLILRFREAERANDVKTMESLVNIVRRLRISAAMTLKAEVDCLIAAGLKVPEVAQAYADHFNEDGTPKEDVPDERN